VGRALAGIQLIEAPAILKSGSPGEPRLIARWLDRAASDNRFEARMSRITRRKRESSSRPSRVVQLGRFRYSRIGPAAEPRFAR
jgi:hypothetical protein